jgi:hypothetical protein
MPLQSGADSVNLGQVFGIESGIHQYNQQASELYGNVMQLV